MFLAQALLIFRQQNKNRNDNDSIECDRKPGNQISAHKRRDSEEKTNGIPEHSFTRKPDPGGLCELRRY